MASFKGQVVVVVMLTGEKDRKRLDQADLPGQEISGESEFAVAGVSLRCCCLERSGELNFHSVATVSPSPYPSRGMYSVI